MDETQILPENMDLEPEKKQRLSSFTSSVSDYSDIFSDDPVELRINKWLDDIGVKITNPEERQDQYFNQKKSEIFMRNSSVSSLNSQYEYSQGSSIPVLPIQKSIKKSKKDSLSNLMLGNIKMNSARKQSGEFILSENNLLSRRRKQIKKASI